MTFSRVVISAFGVMGVNLMMDHSSVSGFRLNQVHS